MSKQNRNSAAFRLNSAKRMDRASKLESIASGALKVENFYAGINSRKPAKAV